MGKILNVMTTKILEGINALALRLTMRKRTIVRTIN